MRTNYMPAPKDTTYLSTETTSIARIPQKVSHHLWRPPQEKSTFKKSVLYFTYRALTCTQSLWTMNLVANHTSLFALATRKLRINL